MRRRGCWIGVVLCLALCFAGCGQRTQRGRSLEGVPVIRVRILESQNQASLDSSSPVIVRLGPSNSTQVRQYPAGQSLAVRLTPSGWQVASLTLGVGELTIAPTGDGVVRINAHPYRGKIRLVGVAPDRFDVVNDVDIDGYLKGVVARELLADWHPEAYRAQAIIARTYALYEWRNTTNRGMRHFDLNSDVRSQVYGGMEAETSKSVEAVDATSPGVVVAYGKPGDERIFKTYFSSCCGGVRQSSADGFGEPHPAMIDMSVGALCNASPRFNWGPVIISKDELTRRLRAFGQRRARAEGSMARLERIDIQATNTFGRPVRFVVTDARGARFSFNGEEMRWAANTGAAPGTTLNSSFFKPLVQSDNIQFIEGHGWGHGVGMCQWCAQTQALQGMPHENIVLSAFPGATLQRAY